MSASRADPAHAMAEVHTVGTPCALDGTIVHGEDHAVAPAERNDFDTRLHARPLLRQHELTTGEIGSRFREQERYLEWEDMLAVQILVQAVVIVRAVPKQEGRRSLLLRLVAPRDELGVRARIAHIDTHRLVPSVGERSEPWIERRPQLGYELGQRVAEILVLSTAEPVSR